MNADSAEQTRQGIALETTARQRVEAAEHPAQRVLEHALQAANVGLWDLDLQTNRMHYSHAWKQQLGYADDEIGDSFDEWECRLHPDDRARARNLAFAHIAAAKPITSKSSACSTKMAAIAGSWRAGRFTVMPTARRHTQSGCTST